MRLFLHPVLWIGLFSYYHQACALLEVFEVYQPISVASDGHDQCAGEERVLVDYDFGNSYSLPYVGFYEPPRCKFDTVRINLTVTSKGRQYDRLAIFYLGDTELWRTSTAEPTSDGIVWTYLKDMSQFNTLWKEKQKIIFDLGNIITDVYTGHYNTTLTAYFSYEDNVKTPDAILPISARRSVQNASSDFELPSDNATVLHRFPPNTSRAVVSIAATGQSTEEFWWSNVFTSDSWSFDNTIGELYGYSPFREVQLYIDGMMAGVVWPFPIIFTGGVAPGFWRPIVGIDAFDLRQPEIDITPWLPMLLDNKTHSFEIRVTGLNISEGGAVTFSDTVGSYWIVTGTIFLYLDESAPQFAPGRKPISIAPPPKFTATRNLVQNAAGGNETLIYSITAQRTFTVQSTDHAWSQNLSYSNYGTLNQQGLSQSNLQHTSGRNQLIGGKVLNDVTFDYPLLCNQTYNLDDGLTISAWMRRGLDIEATEGLGISTYTLTSGPLNLHTEQSGTAFYQSTSNNSASYGETKDVFESDADGVSYSREVHAVNGSVVYDTGN
ncbi:peptide-N4-(N-acetyl-beta-D-glucosaminyl) asparaginase amidase N [Aspergillus indologenus CBS 114.80]|uniref:Peptide-N4-(N-acetyl-beta-D-glucosaminyl) asparaginase amidase N n=1 Tax=Aspergillus indologenus CBS 114.80 TaxID=1450541 RepID=A0A2V5HLR6_9EURO|nr:peptide-N4-(N-acetyl-beta-D-glucosaminyl) asparaginase amidase N [Aspergillus indologenus CBS 114.80]